MNFVYAFDRLDGALSELRELREFEDWGQKQAILDAMDHIKEAMACIKEYSN